MSELVGDRVQVRSCRHQLSRVPVAGVVEPHVPADEPFGNRPGRVLPPEPGDPVRVPGGQHRVGGSSAKKASRIVERDSTLSGHLAYPMLPPDASQPSIRSCSSGVGGRPSQSVSQNPGGS